MHYSISDYFFTDLLLTLLECRTCTLEIEKIYTSIFFDTEGTVINGLLLVRTKISFQGAYVKHNEHIPMFHVFTVSNKKPSKIK